MLVVPGKFQLPFFVLLLGLSCGLPGCGPGRGDLAGKVSFQGKPVKTGSVVVAGSDGVVQSGAINPDGTYEVKDIAAGDIKITVSSPDPAAKAYHPRKKDQQAPPPKDNSMWFALPENYADFAKSDLTFALKPGLNSWDIDLK